MGNYSKQVRGMIKTNLLQNEQVMCSTVNVLAPLRRSNLNSRAECDSISIQVGAFLEHHQRVLKFIVPLLTKGAYESKEDWVNDFVTEINLINPNFEDQVKVLAEDIWDLALVVGEYDLVELSHVIYAVLLTWLYKVNPNLHLKDNLSWSVRKTFQIKRCDHLDLLNSMIRIATNQDMTGHHFENIVKSIIITLNYLKTYDYLSSTFSMAEAMFGDIFGLDMDSDDPDNAPDMVIIHSQDVKINLAICMSFNEKVANKFETEYIDDYVAATQDRLKEFASQIMKLVIGYVNSHRGAEANSFADLIAKLENCDIFKYL